MRDQRMTPKEVAGHFALKEDSAYRWIDDGTIPERFLKFCGRKQILIKAEVIPYLEEIFAQAHGHGKGGVK